jgi:hypothetical protein
MAAAAALGRAVLTAGGTMLALGAATMAVSSVGMGVARVVLAQKKAATAVDCPTCAGQGRTRCTVCKGARVIEHHPFPTPPLPGATRTPWCACPMCAADGEQVCVNCLGEKRVLPLDSGLVLYDCDGERGGASGGNGGSGRRARAAAR